MVRSSGHGSAPAARLRPVRSDCGPTIGRMLEFLLAFAAFALASRWLVAAAAGFGIPTVLLSLLTSLV